MLRISAAGRALQAKSKARPSKSQVTAIGPPFDPVAPLLGASEKM
jgi:hypothetical protein